MIGYVVVIVFVTVNVIGSSPNGAAPVRGGRGPRGLPFWRLYWQRVWPPPTFWQVLPTAQLFAGHEQHG